MSLLLQSDPTSLPTDPTDLVEGRAVLVRVLWFLSRMMHDLTITRQRRQAANLDPDELMVQYNTCIKYPHSPTHSHSLPFLFSNYPHSFSHLPAIILISLSRRAILLLKDYPWRRSGTSTFLLLSGMSK